MINPFPAEGVRHWRVKSSGVRQSQIYKCLSARSTVKGLIGKSSLYRPNYFVWNHTRNQGSSNTYNRLRGSNGDHVYFVVSERAKFLVLRPISVFFNNDQMNPSSGLHPDHVLFKYWIQVIISFIKRLRKTCYIENIYLSQESITV